MSYQHIQKRLRELQEMIMGEMPITRYLNFSIDRYDEKGLVLSAPLSPNINHRGTAFGGSISMMATLAGYGMTLLMLEDLGLPCHILVQKGTISFQEPVRDDFKVICHHPNTKEYTLFKEMFLRRGKGRIYQHCVVQEARKEVNAVTFEGAYVAIKNQG